MKASTFLQRACKRNLARRDTIGFDTPYICCALEEYAHDLHIGPTGNPYQGIVSWLQGEIEVRLDGYDTFGSWAWETHPEIAELLSKVGFQEWRHAWVDSLVAELKSKGQ